MKEIIFDQNVPSVSLTIKKLENDTRYYWKLSSVTGESEKLKGIYSFYTKSTTAPSAPDWVMADKNNNRTVTLTWNPTAGATSYTVYRKKINILGFSSFKPIATNLTNPNYKDKSAIHDSHYSYVVTAKNTRGESGESIEVQTDKHQAAFQLITLLSAFLMVVSCVIFIRVTRDKSKANLVEGQFNKIA
jgi:hypothetical protein